jgi:hypothetical protein
MIPVGNYRAKATKAEPGKAGTGNEQVLVTFQITQGPQAGQEIVWRGMFTEKTTDRTIDALILCGWDTNDYVSFSGITKNEVEIVIEHEAGRDDPSKMFARVKWVNNPNRGPKQEAMSAPEIQSFAARLKGKVLAAKERAAKAAQEADSFPFGANEPKF